MCVQCEDDVCVLVQNLITVLVCRSGCGCFDTIQRKQG